MNNSCVYIHRKLTDNEIFYVGIGERKYRPYKKTSRTKHWNNIVKKYGYVVEIVAENLSWEEASLLEQNLILKYGRIDLNTGILCNMTDGGEGSKGRPMLDTTKEKIRNAAFGNTRKVGKKMSLESRLKMSADRGYKIIDTETGIIYNSINEVSKIFNITCTVLARFLKGCNTRKSYNFKYHT